MLKMLQYDMTLDGIRMKLENDRKIKPGHGLFAKEVIHRYIRHTTAERAVFY